ncbi:urea ABC transporter permease subunit UrtC [Amphibiibacter pelophylacis]|uniref:Urea ABC transporter permease subunit UrtC n=1 Tax=Amphibiibacter pelophylacis TaxID=1799477 RepID=A0ACC6P1C2_9BURK
MTSPDPRGRVLRIADLPERAPLFSRPTWLALLGLTLLACIAVPLMVLVAPPDSVWHLSAYGVTLLGKILCYATAALALNLVWGYCGILSLGHALFFALGGYVMGMHLVRVAAGGGLPEFMSFLDWQTLPWFWQASGSLAATLLLIVLVPGLLALALGWMMFRSRIKGVYLSIITQALTYCAMLLFFRNETGLGGNNGFTGFRTLLGWDITQDSTRLVLLGLSFALLLGSLLLCRAIMVSRLGKVVLGLRDAEGRLTTSGYSALPYRLVIWTISAVLCGIAGALYVPQVGIINPGEMAPVQSIEMAIWVAVGGRATVWGPIVGALGVNGAKTVLTATWADGWLFVLGGLFVLVTLWLPGGLVSLGARLKALKGTAA